MTIAFSALGAKSAGGTTALAIPHPAGITAGGLLIPFRCAWLSSATVATPAGYTAGVNGIGGTGTASGNHTTRVRSDYKVADGTESGNLATTQAGSPSGALGVMALYTKASTATWSVQLVAGESTDNTHGANRAGAATSGSASIQPGDMVVVLAGVDTNTALTITSPTYSVGGGTARALTRRTSGAGVATGLTGNLEVFDRLAAETESGTVTVSLTTATNQCGPACVMVLRELVPDIRQVGYRFRNNDGTETTATWKEALNTYATTQSGQVFRLRFAVENVGTGSGSVTDYQLYASKNGAAYAAVGASTGATLGVQASAGALTESQATTQQVTTGTFVAGMADETEGYVLGATLAAASKTELEFTLIAPSANVVTGDLLYFRVYRGNGSALDGYSQTPRMEIVAAGPATVTSGVLPLALTVQPVTPQAQPVTVTAAPLPLVLATRPIVPTPQLAAGVLPLTLAVQPSSVAALPASVTAAPIPLTLAARPVTPTAQPVTIAAAPIPLVLQTQPVNPAAQPVTITAAPIPLTFTIRPGDTLPSVTGAPLPLELAMRPVTPTALPAAVTVAPLVLQLTARPSTPTALPVTVAAAPLPLALAVRPVVPTPLVAGVSLALQLLMRPVTPQPLPVTVAAVPLPLTVSVRPAVATPLAAAAPLPLALQLVPVTPAALPVTVSVQPIPLQLGVRPVTLAGQQSIDAQALPFTLTVRPVVPAAQPVTIVGAPIVLQVAVRPAAVSALPVTVAAVAVRLELGLRPAVPQALPVTVQAAPVRLQLLVVAVGAGSPLGPVVPRVLVAVLRPDPYTAELRADSARASARDAGRFAASTRPGRYDARVDDDGRYTGVLQ